MASNSKDEIERIASLGIPVSEEEARVILGSTSAADFKTLRRAYRALAGIAHPDRFVHDSKLSTHATLAMQVLNAAWEIVDGLHAVGALGNAGARGGQRSTSHAASAWGPVIRMSRNDECDLCGSWPARAMTIRSITSVLIFFSPGKYDGTVCRSCGTSLFRNALRRTMIGGWWGIGTIALPFYFIAFVMSHSTLKAMRPPAFRDINVAAPFRSPVIPPKSPLKSVGPMLASGIAILVILWIVVGSATSSPQPTTNQDQPLQQPAVTQPAQDQSDYIRAGQCFNDSGASKVEPVNCADPHDYLVTTVVSSASACAETDDISITIDIEVACAVRTN